ncbi:DNA-directed RNA polymerase I subunit RPA12 isoform X2 [Pyrus x bretschneideri]|uniref:DNA-directed RNA polymerase I subunit RPA12 isoform X2 n=1 Tax=Pyrus x bretschneideri TaxID=225117 RepID=UPI00087099FC|nr:DNA-directed RNA polymerase I subunit RPA12 isoform X2 [Pyrus x bretschneideri]
MTIARATTISNGASEKHFMAYSQGRNFLFCDLCGSLLNLNSNKYAQCPLCKLQRNVKEISGREISYKVTAEDIRRDLGISIIPEERVQLQKTDAKTCEKCGHNEHTYYSRQMRSADEGATTFYVCTNCQHQFTEN